MFARFSAALVVLAVVGATPGQAPVPAPAAPGAPPRTHSARIANYSIDARLDPSTRTISADQVLTWRNASANPASSLRFHLYFNAWRNAQSTWMRERRLLAGAPELAVTEADRGWIDVSAVRIGHRGTESDVTSSLKFISPDDDNPHDRTVAEIPLEAPVLPGETIAVRFSWSSRVPRTFARTGVKGDYYFVAQWFPKIAVLEDSGWNSHQFHATTEFFSDFGTYDVRLTVPRGWVVGATGTERERRDQQDGTTTHRYYQEDVHDFAWTTSPDYQEVTDTFEHPALPAVRMRLLLQPEHRGQEQRHFEATRAALRYYGEWFGPYPYGHLTIVDPAWGSGAGGMEYPTLFTAGTRWIAPRGATQPESVTIHEAGHQFWYGIVATNEFEHAWMDEGINTFATTRVIAQVFEPNYVVRRYFGGYIPWVLTDLPLSRETDTRSSVAYRAAARGDRQALPSWQYWPRSAATTTYHKTALWLHTLERMLGWETLQRMLSTYFQRWAYRHPSPRDFFAVANEVSGQDLAWFFDQVHGAEASFDYGIDQFHSEPAAASGTAANAATDTGEDGRAAGTFRTTVVVRRHAAGVFPVDVRVLLENGEEVRWRWEGRERWRIFEVDRPVRALRADVDPARVLLLDVHRTNNSATIEPESRRAARKWSLAWLIWLQDHLLTYGFFV